MSLIDLLLLAVALGIDCLVVSFSQGLIFNSNRLKNSLKLALTMGIFQGGMPFIGYVGADYIHDFIEPYSKWLVFGIFFVLGLKFIFEALQLEKEEICCIGWRCLISLGVATSIDALVAGASLNLISAPLVLSVVVIGLTSFIMSLCGFWTGNLGKQFPSKYLEIAGGVILIFLALKSILI
ncbi:manganese efflux pump [bacterium]|nr:manganese efflux pump [bacterium]